MKKDVIKVIVFVIIAVAAFYEYFVCDVAFLLPKGGKRTMLVAAQIINLGVILMGAMKVDEFIDWLFKKKKEGA